MFIVIAYCRYFYKYWTVLDDRLESDYLRPTYLIRAIARGDTQRAARGLNEAECGDGLSDSTIKSIPLFEYGDPALRRTLEQQEEAIPSKECCICLSGFEDREAVRLLPSCYHLFHKSCIDVWFASHCTCPLCRRIVLPCAKLYPARSASFRYGSQVYIVAIV
ncbi:hypothetical protein KP509_22G021100 [Ceratopteris richardii]|nr:hypothetical protein KP509_22G021100 [Ceratopteris richardii]